MDRPGGNGRYAGGIPGWVTVTRLWLQYAWQWSKWRDYGIADGFGNGKGSLIELFQ